MSALTVSTTQSHRSSRNYPGLPAILGFAAFLLVSAPALAQVLGTASNFAVLGATPNVTNTGPSVITGNVGVSPAASITGFPPGTIVPGTGFLHFGDAIAQQAQSDTTAAYLTLAGLVSASIPPALGGQTLTPGVYNAGAANLTGTLTLNGPGLYVFQTTSLTTASGPGASIVNLINGATPCDVWWQVGSSAAIGTFSAVRGNILALTSITIATSASLQGRALARNGTVTLDSNAVTACSGGTAPGFLVPPAAPIPPGPSLPMLGKAFSPANIIAGGVSTLTVTLSNPDAAVATLTAPFIDTLPSGVVIAATPNAATTCGGVGAPVAIAGSSTVTLPAGRTIPANSSCTLTVNVTAAVVGFYINTLPAGALVTSNGNNAAPAVAALAVPGPNFGIPTLSEWAMIMLAALLAFAGFAAMRRKAR